MKILYSAGNHIDNNQQLLRFIQHSTEHEIKIAAYVKSSDSFTHVHWTLDALFNRLTPKNPQEISELLGHTGAPKTITQHTEILLKEVDDFEPDLIISNAEPVLANLAKALSVKLWYCSPLHLLTGIEWDKGDLKYLSLLAPIRKLLEKLPVADKTLIYSPFGDLTHCPTLKTGYEWIQPYWIPVENKSRTQNVAMVPNKTRTSKLTKLLNCVNFDLTLFTHFSDSFTHMQTKLIDDLVSYQEALSNCNWFFSTGDTSYLADAIYNEIPKVCVAPSLDEPENLLNSILCKSYGLGDDIAQIELMEKYAVAELDKSQSVPNKQRYSKHIRSLRLDEKVSELCM
jgi:hypothetical protein